MGRSILRDIRMDPGLAPYYAVTRDFFLYLEDTRGARFRFRGYDPVEMVEVETEVEYVHRWTDSYRKGWIAKMYQLDEWYQETKPPVTMLSLTTYQDGAYSRSAVGGLSIPESFEVLKSGWDKLSKVLRKPENLGKFDYFSVMEPHKSGYPHLHVPVFAEIPETLQDKLSTLYESYGAGSYDHGLQFEARDHAGDIRSLRNYLLKYLSKGLGGTGSKFGEDLLTPGQYVFHALVWKHGWRLFSSSQSLSRVMRWKKDRGVTEWLATDLLKDGVIHPVWRLEGSDGLQHGLFGSWESPDDGLPEGQTIDQEVI